MFRIAVTHNVSFVEETRQLFWLFIFISNAWISVTGIFSQKNWKDPFHLVTKFAVQALCKQMLTNMNEVSSTRCIYILQIQSAKLRWMLNNLRADIDFSNYNILKALTWIFWSSIEYMFQVLQFVQIYKNRIGDLEESLQT